ncbi:MAG: phenylacetic acid degradation bifunctional protein PaaZ [Pseudomonadota bacterium]
MRAVHSYAMGRWVAPGAEARDIESANTGEIIARAGGAHLDMAEMRGYAVSRGGPALRKLGFHDRARMLKAVALYLKEHRELLYDLSFDTGATAKDHLIDVDGGISTMLVYASKGRREMPDGHIYLDGGPEMLGRSGQFQGQHICTPRQGVAVHINAYNFPVWGMLEKLAPTWLAGMPAIVKPATSTCYVAEACVRLIQDSGLIPDGALQLIVGGVGDLFDHLTGQDVVTFTGSAATGLTLRSHPALLRNAVPFTAEQDSLNASILGLDVVPTAPEFDLFIEEVVREMTVKAGQKCTAIRRIMVPEALIDPIQSSLVTALQDITVGDSRQKHTQMGALVSGAQKQDVLSAAEQIGTEAERVCGDVDAYSDVPGSFLPPMLFRCDAPNSAEIIHETEAFGPVSTLIPYQNAEHAAHLMNRGKGALVASVITHDGAFARDITLAAAAFHGRLYFNNRDSMDEATGHGAPLPHMVHGGPGRAGGGEELGGIRAVLHYMQRTAVQGSPDILRKVIGTYVKGARTNTAKPHPFTRSFNDLEVGDTLITPPRAVTLDDIETFAHFTGDTFYAHMDDTAAAANPFFPGRVAHGYLLLSFAAGLFVHPEPGPVLANTGLDNLRFMAPVSPGDSIFVHLTVKAKTRRTDDYGEVRWHVAIYNHDEIQVAQYDLLTMNEY